MIPTEIFQILATGYTYRDQDMMLLFKCLEATMMGMATCYKTAMAASWQAAQIHYKKDLAIILKSSLSLLPMECALDKQHQFVCCPSIVS